MKNIELLINRDEGTSRYACNEESVNTISQRLKESLVNSTPNGRRLESVQSRVLSLYLENEVRLMLYDPNFRSEGNIYKQAEEFLQDDRGIIFGRTENLNKTMLHHVMFSHRECIHEVKHPSLKLDCGAAIINTLIENGADVNARTGNDDTPFHLAASNHCETAMKILLSTGDVDDKCIDSGLSDLMNEIYNPKDKPENKETATSQWLVNRLESCLKLLISHDVNPNFADNTFHNTPLHSMLQNYYVTLPLVQKFSELCHPDMGSKNYFGLTPLHLCAKAEKDFSGDRANILRFICSKQRNAVDDVDLNGRTALMHSIRESNKDFCDVLLTCGARIDSVDKNGCTPLHYAAISADDELANMLIREHNADINARDFNGDSPIVYAAACGNINVLKLLLQHQAPDKETYERLITVTHCNANPQCYALVDSLITDSKSSQTKYEESILSTRRIEIDPRHVDNFLDDIDSQAASQAQNDEDSLLLKQFYSLQKIQGVENEQICREVTELFRRISQIVTQSNQYFTFTSILSGSNSEGTKVGVVDELDFLCNLEYLASEYHLEVSTDSDQQPGLVRLQLSATNELTLIDPVLLSTAENKTFLSSFGVGHQLLKAICKALSYESIWQDLHLAWEYETVEGHISTLKLLWIGENFKGKEISIDVVPTLKIKSKKANIAKIHLNFFESIGLEDAIQDLTVVAKHVRSENATRPDLLWRVSYAQFESKIFQKLPQVIRDAYKLTKFARDKRICPYLRFPRCPIISEEPTAYVTSYMLKISVFHEILECIQNSDLSLDCYDAKTWASKFLRRLEVFMASSEVFPSFFDPRINLKTNDFELCVIAFCKIGRKWLHLQWEDIYDGKTVQDDGVLPQFLSIGKEVVRKSITESRIASLF